MMCPPSFLFATFGNPETEASFCPFPLNLGHSPAVFGWRSEIGRSHVQYVQSKQRFFFLVESFYILIAPTRTICIKWQRSLTKLPLFLETDTLARLPLVGFLPHWQKTTTLLLFYSQDILVFYDRTYKIFTVLCI